MAMWTRAGAYEGWGLLWSLMAAVVLWSAATFLVWGGGAEGVRAAIRATARISLLLFLGAFLASSLHALMRRGATQWLCRNRRYLGLGFAWSHFVHLLFILLFWRLDAPAFLEGRTPGSFVPGTIGYLFIAALAATSFDGPARRIGPKAWKLLHVTGVWFIFVQFAVSFGKRVEAKPAYVWFMVLLAAALAVRIGGWMAKRRRGAAVTTA